jgi:hypothetical protein
MTAKSKVRPHVFVADPDVPPDSNGRGACRACHLIGAAGDSHHTLPAAPMDAQRLAAGEDEENRNGL